MWDTLEKCIFLKKAFLIFIRNVSYFFHEAITTQAWRGICLKDIKSIVFEKSNFSVSSPFMFFKFLFIHKTFLGGVCFFNDIPYLAKLPQRKLTTQSGKNFTRFCFVLFWILVFMCKCR